MSHRTNKNREAQLETYLDGLLHGPALEAFEQELETSPFLRTEVRRQEAVEEVLRTQYAVPDADRITAAIESRLRSQSPKSLLHRRASQRRQHLALAAAVVLGAISVWRFWGFMAPSEKQEYPVRRQRPMHVAYAEEAKRGFPPDWVCKTDEQFSNIFRRRFGQALFLAALPTGVKAGGVAYHPSLSSRTVVVLADVNGTRVMVFADEAEPEDVRSLPADCGLRLFRRDIGRIVLYEVTPLNRPSILGYFRTPASN